MHVQLSPFMSAVSKLALNSAQLPNVCQNGLYTCFFVFAFISKKNNLVLQTAKLKTSILILSTEKAFVTRYMTSLDSWSMVSDLIR